MNAATSADFFASVDRFFCKLDPKLPSQIRMQLEELAARKSEGSKDVKENSGDGYRYASSILSNEMQKCYPQDGGGKLSQLRSVLMNPRFIGRLLYKEVRHLNLDPAAFWSLFYCHPNNAGFSGVFTLDDVDPEIREWNRVTDLIKQTFLPLVHPLYNLMFP